MANVLGELFRDTANAIREKTGELGGMKPAEFPGKIRAIRSTPNLIPLSVTENGTYSPDETVKQGGTYAYKDSYTQEELQSLFRAVVGDKEGDIQTHLFISGANIDSAAMIRRSNGIYTLILIDNGDIFIYASDMNDVDYGEVSEGWYEIDTDDNLVAIDGPPSVYLSKESFTLALGDISELSPLFALGEVDGFSDVTVNVVSDEPTEAPTLIPLVVTENGVYEPPTGEFEVGKSYKMKDSYDTETLQTFYEKSIQVTENGDEALLQATASGTILIWYLDGLFALVVSQGNQEKVWLSEEFASFAEMESGWYLTDESGEVTPSEAPYITIGELDMLFVHGGLSVLSPLYELEKADGFSSVSVNVAGSGGGASIDGVEAYMVTYVGADGSTLHTKPTVAGDDTYDPYALGKIPKPTKESSAQYTYEHNGWSLTQDGAVNATALKRVQADRTIYAAFEATTRTYTVRFWDGDTLMLETQVAYGSTVTPPNHAKEGTIFLGWTPSDFTITQDTDFHGSWIEGISFESAPWEQIKMISESGEASNLFSIGDERTITMTWSDGSTEDCVIRIAAFDADTIYDSGNAGKAGITIETKGVVSKTSTSGISSTKIYANSALRSAMNNVIYPALPSDLQAVIKNTFVPSTYVYDKVSPLCATNLGIFQDGINAAYPTSYAEHYPLYYKETTLAQKGQSTRIKYDINGTPQSYWLCDRNSKLSSMQTNNTGSVSATGGVGYNDTSSQLCMSFRFAI